MASNLLPRATNSIESAMTSRLTSEAFMPSAPMVMPSEMDDGVELHRRAAGGADAFLDLGRQAAQMVIARADFDPGVGDADDRVAQVFVGEADGLEHGACPGAAGAIGDGLAVGFEGVYTAPMGAEQNHG